MTRVLLMVRSLFVLCLVCLPVVDASAASGAQQAEADFELAVAAMRRDDASDQDRWIAARLLSGLPEDRRVKIEDDLATSLSWRHRESAVLVAHAGGASAAWELESRRRLSADPVWLVRARALHSWRSLPLKKVGPRVRAALKDPFWRVRLAALDVVHNAPDLDAALEDETWLLGFDGEEDLRVREAWAWILLKAMPEAAGVGKRIHEAFHDGNTAPLRKALGLRLLAGHRQRSWRLGVFDRTRASSMDRRWLEALAESDPDKRLAALLAAYRDRDVTRRWSDAFRLGFTAMIAEEPGIDSALIVACVSLSASKRSARWKPADRAEKTQKHRDLVARALRRALELQQRPWRKFDFRRDLLECLSANRDPLPVVITELASSTEPPVRAELLYLFRGLEGPEDEARLQAMRSLMLAKELEGADFRKLLADDQNIPAAVAWWHFWETSGPAHQASLLALARSWSETRRGGLRALLAREKDQRQSLPLPFLVEILDHEWSSLRRLAADVLQRQATAADLPLLRDATNKIKQLESRFHVVRIRLTLGDPQIVDELLSDAAKAAEAGQWPTRSLKLLAGSEEPRVGQFVATLFREEVSELASLVSGVQILLQTRQADAAIAVLRSELAALRGESALLRREALNDGAVYAAWLDKYPLEPLLPELMKSLWHEDWQHREFLLEALAKKLKGPARKTYSRDLIARWKDLPEGLEGHEPRRELLEALAILGGDAAVKAVRETFDEALRTEAPVFGDNDAEADRSLLWPSAEILARRPSGRRFLIETLFDLEARAARSRLQGTGKEAGPRELVGFLMGVLLGAGEGLRLDEELQTELDRRAAEAAFFETPEFAGQWIKTGFFSRPRGQLPLRFASRLFLRTSQRRANEGGWQLGPLAIRLLERGLEGDGALAAAMLERHAADRIIFLDPPRLDGESSVEKMRRYVPLPGPLFWGQWRARRLEGNRPSLDVGDREFRRRPEVVWERFEIEKALAEEMKRPAGLRSLEVVDGLFAKLSRRVPSMRLAEGRRLLLAGRHDDAFAWASRFARVSEAGRGQGAKAFALLAWEALRAGGASAEVKTRFKASLPPRWAESLRP